jgi:hypothetical protein
MTPMAATAAIQAGAVKKSLRAIAAAVRLFIAMAIPHALSSNLSDRKQRTRGPARRKFEPLTLGKPSDCFRTGANESKIVLAQFVSNSS